MHMPLTTKLVTIFPHQKHGGPLSFSNNLIKSVKGYGINVNQELTPNDNGPILLINGTRKILPLLKCKHNGRRIVLRLGSPENLHSHLNVNLSIKCKGYLIQKLLIFLRKYVADAVIYQSKYVKKEWHLLAGAIKNEHVIYNGVDTAFYAPSTHHRENIILSVEGSQGNDPFDIAINLHDELIKKHNNFRILMIGKPCLEITSKVKKCKQIEFIGEVSKEKLQEYYRKSKCYLLTDYLGAGCPNALLEAIASGCVPLAFNTGPVSEMYLNKTHGHLINDTAHILSGEFFSNYQHMAESAIEILTNSDDKSQACRELAANKYNLDFMRDEYLKILWPR